MSENLHNWQETHSIWHRITGEADQPLPDSDITIMVYDADLEDVVFATAELNEDTNRVLWWDTQLDQPLPNPSWWADVPFPEDI